MTDEVTLTLPRERPFYPIAQLVLGGLAAHHDVTLEHLEDLELAVGGVLDRLSGEEPATLKLRVADDRMLASVGPLDDGLRSELDRDGRGRLDLRRLLDTVVDAYELVERDGVDWIDVAKAVR